MRLFSQWAKRQAAQAASENPSRSALAVAVALAAALLIPAIAFAQELSVTAAIETDEVFVGAPFTLQIQVQGSDKVERPDLSGLADFQVTEAGGGQNNSQSISIVNGKITRVVSRGFTFSYQLTARRAGELTIPAISVTAEGQTRRTQPIRIRAKPPAENDDFKLRLELSEQRCYVGQPVILSVTWYVGRNVEEFQFNVPLLEDKRFDVAGFNDDIDPSQQDNYVRIPLGSDVVIGRKGRATLDGRTFLTVKFEKVLIPKQAGSINVRPATISMRAVQGYQRRNSGLNDFFGDSFFGRRAVYEDLVVPSNTPTFEVAALPEAGRPAGFSGLVGSFEVEAEATPTDISVGDPITLNVLLKGPRFLQNVTLPPLEQQASLTRDFRIPEERATGVIRGNVKVFTQTLRATHSSVTEIPPIEVPYFDPKTGAYEIARSQPIALKVEGNRIITAQDAEGRDAVAVTQTELEAREEGIAYNYESSDALINQAGSLTTWLNSPLGLLLLLAPPVGYGGLLAFVVLARRRGADPTGRRARRAHRDFTRRLQTLDAGSQANTDAYHSHLLDALRAYLGARLELPPGALTFGDVAGVLQQRGAAEQTIAELRGLFEQCEAGRYAGGMQSESAPANLTVTARNVAARLEQELQ